MRRGALLIGTALFLSMPELKLGPTYARRMMPELKLGPTYAGLVMPELKLGPTYEGGRAVTDVGPSFSLGRIAGGCLQPKTSVIDARAEARAHVLG